MEGLPGFQIKKGKRDGEEIDEIEYGITRSR